MSGPLAGKVCIVTGASRGIGKGIALQLGEAGATVYITGRGLSPSGDVKVGGTLQSTAEEIESRGGKCIPVQCDHGNDEDVNKLFERVKTEQNGRLDVLVNNAYSGVTAIAESVKAGNTFWEEEDGMWDTINKVGLRGHYIAAVHAARLMVPAKQGLIINVSSPGGLMHFATIPYCIGKSGCDRMASECAIDLRKHNIAYVSLWPGAVRTEHVLSFGKGNEDQSTDDKASKMMKRMIETGETPEFAGKAVVHLAADPNIMKKSGKIVHTTWVANAHGYSDVDGRHHIDPFSIKYMLNLSGHTWLAGVTPEFIRFPGWMVAAMYHHF
ncbi:dehydrogenase/reductase SDR family member 1-like [Amphiura filiformis]|uniref:dehydrogenase/reductase SDR family member 1-like n=1 Tax=Amphiura filiformis TaxID=82378 RepID=UPI003B213FDE